MVLRQNSKWIKGVVIIYSRGGRWKTSMSNDRYIPITTYIGHTTQNSSRCVVIEGGHVLSASDFRNSTAPPAVNNDHSLKLMFSEN